MYWGLTPNSTPNWHTFRNTSFKARQTVKKLQTFAASKHGW
jgi:hypothetical protein